MIPGEGISTSLVKNYLLNLQDMICRQLENEDPGASFIEDAWSRDSDEEGHQGPVLGGVDERGSSTAGAFLSRPG